MCGSKSHPHLPTGGLTFGKLTSHLSFSICKFKVIKILKSYYYTQRDWTRIKRKTLETRERERVPQRSLVSEWLFSTKGHT